MVINSSGGGGGGGGGGGAQGNIFLTTENLVRLFYNKTSYEYRLFLFPSHFLP